MPRGGLRAGAGRKKKALQEKLLDGNPGKTEITITKFNKAKDNEILRVAENSGKSSMPINPSFELIYDEISAWVTSSGCAELIPVALIEDFALLRQSWLEREYMSRKSDKKSEGKTSPFSDQALKYHKEMVAVYVQIWNILYKNTQEKFEKKNEFVELFAEREF